MMCHAMLARVARGSFSRSANSTNSNNVWNVNNDGNLNNNNYNNNNGVRPTSFGTITYWTKVNKYKT